jgi:hypothetical protein
MLTQQRVFGRGSRVPFLLVGEYAAVPEEQRRDRLDADADRITGEVARYLQAARGRITPSRVGR